MPSVSLLRYCKLSIVILLFAGGLSGCSKSDNSGDIREHKYYNLSYGNHERQKLDVYLPANRGQNTPFLLLIHGGAWVAGDKSSMNLLQDSLMKRGIASASMNYRYVAEQIHYPELMQDVAAALGYCYDNRGGWNIRSDRYIIGGASAGAHMALLYAYRYDTNNKLGAVISAAGPTDLTHVDFLNYVALLSLLDEVEKMVGATYQPGQPLNARFAEASPRAHIKSMPTLLLHGSNDAVVPYVQSQVLASDLNTAGVIHKLVTFQGAGHDLGLGNATYLQLFLTEMELWCKTYGK